MNPDERYSWKLAKELFLKEHQRDGEVYAGVILGKGGNSSYHLFLLPGQATGVTWNQALAFAKKAGGSLPTRREQLLLVANLKEEFGETWYWSCEQYARISGYAWYQYFLTSSQHSSDTNNKLQARAVRRLAI